MSKNFNTLEAVGLEVAEVEVSSGVESSELSINTKNVQR